MANTQARDSVDLNKLTYRQYMAIAYILSQKEKDGHCPTVDEIKQTIGFSTDRMVKKTLNALEKKGFVEFNGLDNGKLLHITKGAKEAEAKLMDKLLATEEKIEFDELMDNIKIEKRRDYLQFELPSALKGKDLLKESVNEKGIVNRWYSLLQDFQPSLVWEYMDRFGIDKGDIVLDPFSGSGTTATTAKLSGIDAIGVDINPIAIFVSKVKTKWDVDYRKLKKTGNEILNELKEIAPILDNKNLETEILKNMEKIKRRQWLKPRVENDVVFTKKRIESVSSRSLKDSLNLALIEAAKEASNASFCPGTSFYPFKQRPDFFDSFRSKLLSMVRDLALLRRWGVNFGNVDIYKGDSRKVDSILDRQVDFVFTSPPYPNDLEYTRNTRLDLFLLDKVNNMKDIQNIKRNMVKGSTKLIYKESNSERFVKRFDQVQEVASDLEEAFRDKNWGWDYPRMVKEYFGDIYLSLKAVHRVLKDDRYCIYVVGDQSYKGVLIPVGDVIQTIAQDIGYRSTSSETHRIRRSTLHDTPLEEELIILKK